MTVRRKVLVTAAAAVLLWAEYENWRASVSFTGHVPAAGEIVVVLGCRNRGKRANALNRWRVRAGLRSQDERLSDSDLLFSGGAVGTAWSEASLMAQYAVTRRPRVRILLEEQSSTTWENVMNVIPAIEDYERIKIVSNSTHAAKARRYLVQQRPDLERRIARGSDYRFGEWTPIKAVFALYGLRSRFRSLAARNPQVSGPG